MELKIGDLVRVADDIERPYFGWGHTRPHHVGEILAIVNDNVWISWENRPEFKWHGLLTELELAEGGGIPRYQEII